MNDGQTADQTEADVVGPVFEEYRMQSLLPEDITHSGYESESEESAFSYSDSVHYSGSEAGDLTDEELAPITDPSLSSLSTDSVVGELETSEDESSSRTLPCSEPLPQVFYGPYRIFFDMEIDGNFLGRIIIKLGNQFPRCRNHIDKLCTGTLSDRGRTTMHYTGTRFHRLSPGGYLEGGLLRPFIPELTGPFYEEKAVVNPQYYDSYIMVAKKDINDEFAGARFIITTSNRVKHCDPQHVPIGCVVSGMDVIDRIATIPVDDNGYFRHGVTIGHCGSIKQTDEEHWPRGRFEKQGEVSSYLYKIFNRRSLPPKKSFVVHKCNPYREEQEENAKRIRRSGEKDDDDYSSSGPSTSSQK